MPMRKYKEDAPKFEYSSKVPGHKFSYKFRPTCCSTTMLLPAAGAITAQHGKLAGCNVTAICEPSPLSASAPQQTKLASRNWTTKSEPRVPQQKEGVKGCCGE